MKTYETIHEAYLGSLADVYDDPDHVAAPRGQNTREKLDYQFRVLKPMATPIVTLDEARNGIIQAYTKQETELYNSCINSVEAFAKASKFWLKLANFDGTVNSAYGYLIWGRKSHGSPHYEVGASGRDPMDTTPREQMGMLRTPWDWAKLSLQRDKDTRQAILRFSLPEHQFVGNLDQVCTLHGIFMIRDNKLNLSITMRSNDLTLGLVYDLPWFISLIYRMRDELKETYPDLGIGTYTHSVHSLHIYDRDEEKILKMLGRK